MPPIIQLFHLKHGLMSRGYASMSAGLAFVLLLPSCSDIVFATRTSAGVEVTGDANMVPTHVNFGFRRRELIYAGPRAPKDQSILGAIDSETSWTQGAAIREIAATGAAAEIIAGGDPSLGEVPTANVPQPQPLVFATRTRVGIGINLGGADDDAIPSGYLGYSRRIATRIRSNGQTPLPSVVSDVTVHTSSLIGGAGRTTGGLDQAATLSDGSERGGARIRQFFAIGNAASAALRQPAAEANTGSSNEASATASSETVADRLRKEILKRAE